MLAAPAETRFLGERNFHDWRAVGERAVAKRTRSLRNALGELLEAPAHHFVVVAPERVARNVRTRGIVHDVLGRSTRRRQIVHPRGNDAHGALDELGGAGALRPMGCHIIHVPVPAASEPGAQTLFSRSQVAVGNPDLLKSQLLAPAPDIAGEHDEIRRLRLHLLHTANLKPQISRFLPDESATTALGVALAQVLERSLVIYLEGDLGAGKTTLARGILRGLGYERRVKSPTFTLVEAYSFFKLNLYHFDFYRFDDPQELADSGLTELFNESAVCLIEWPEKAAGLPPADIRIGIRITDGGRTVDLRADTEIGRLCLQRLRDRQVT